ncbi:hypothetical protein NQ317_007214 [Molorchus minor]|uniref:U5 small nuclear ribonucleoprotein TSSC4 n=1 Tax=Molorchus minor TaxID=1323400 RepID=A0ABQ9JTS2_9CUCU|nr:hypothetical protein NQ317_007214 [Molorchus minor]
MFWRIIESTLHMNRKQRQTNKLAAIKEFSVQSQSISEVRKAFFKKPQNPIPKNYINRIPDFKKNPHKWTKYSLDDVKEDDMSDKGNTRAALSFLKELEDRKSTNMECDDDGNDDLPTKITFKRYTYPVSIKKEDNKDEDISKPSFRSSKVVMPEYVVGQKAKKDKKNNSTKTTTGKELKLDHLYEED